MNASRKKELNNALQALGSIWASALKDLYENPKIKVTSYNLKASFDLYNIKEDGEPEYIACIEIWHPENRPIALVVDDCNSCLMSKFGGELKEIGKKAKYVCAMCEKEIEDESTMYFDEFGAYCSKDCVINGLIEGGELISMEVIAYLGIDVDRIVQNAKIEAEMQK